MQQKVIDSIIEIRNKLTNQKIPIESKRLEFEISKYSSKKDSIWHIYINDNKIIKKSNLVIKYKCSECETPNEVCTTQFLRKLRSGKSKCHNCTLEIHNSQPDHNKPKGNTQFKKLNLIELHEKSITDFESYPDEYKNNYLLHHLTEEDFNRIKSKIISFCNGKYTDLNVFDYWSIYKVNNQMAFSSVLYDRTTNTIMKANQPIMKCDNCDKTWRAKSLESFKNSYKILCVDCKLCNRIFKIRTAQNINNEKITYQSKLEKKFINWCNNNNLLVKNGPKIEYEFNGNEKIYKVDFQVDDILIEVKDYHCWHKEQVISGKWVSKEKAAKNYIKQNNYKDFFTITSKNWDELTNKIKLINKI